MLHALIADGNSSAWSFGSSMITFVFPIVLFIVVAAALYVLYTKPGLVPGHRGTGAERSVSHTLMPGEPRAAGNPAATTPGDGE